LSGRGGRRGGQHSGEDGEVRGKGVLWPRRGRVRRQERRT
jgi:hypothetical protein